MAGAEAPLARKLGIRPGARVALLAAPPGMAQLVAPLPDGARVVRRPAPRADVIVAFGTRAADLRRRFAAALKALPANGGLWLAYPKQASGVATDLTFASVQALGLGAGLVDNKSAAIDEIWTGLRFVVPLARRAAWPRR